MLKFKEAYKHLSLLPANVVNSNLSISSKSYIINVGKKDNIVKNLSVIDAYGNFHGHRTKAYARVLRKELMTM